jgi:ParB family chromosome partitioning protein
MPILVKSIPLSQIQPSKHQARKEFDPETLKGLADSMKAEGLIQPVTVRPVGDAFELISGERRLRAAKSLNWDAIDARVIETSSEAEAAAKGLVENVQREDLNPIEEAEGFQELSQLDPTHWTQGKIAEATGKGRTHVNEYLQFLGLPEEVKEGVRRRTLSAGHAVELLRINNANSQVGMANKIIKGGWSVKQTRAAIDKLSEKPKQARPFKIEQGFYFERVGDHVRIHALIPVNTLDDSARRYAVQLEQWCSNNQIQLNTDAARGTGHAAEGSPSATFAYHKSSGGTTVSANNAADAEALLKKIQDIDAATK